MKGQVKKMIDTIILQRSNGDPVLGSTIRTKLILKGVNPRNFTEDTVDDPMMLDKIMAIAREFQVRL